MATLVKNRQKQLYYATVRETFGYWQFFIAAHTKCSPSESDLLASDGVLQRSKIRKCNFPHGVKKIIPYLPGTPPTTPFRPLLSGIVSGTAAAEPEVEEDEAARCN